MSDIEGKAALGSGERVERRASFKHRYQSGSGSKTRDLKNLCPSVYICGFSNSF